MLCKRQFKVHIKPYNTIHNTTELQIRLLRGALCRILDENILMFTQSFDAMRKTYNVEIMTSMKCVTEISTVISMLKS